MLTSYFNKIVHYIKNAIFLQILHENTITYVRSDESNGLPFLWSATEMWKSLSERADILHVPGSHLEMQDEIRGKICGSIMMTTAVMKYQSTFSNLQVVRSRSQQRLVESMKQGMVISILPSPSKKTISFNIQFFPNAKRPNTKC